MENFELKSYQAHIKNIGKLTAKRFHLLKHKDTIGYKMIEEQMSAMLPFVQNKRKWLTIGDMYGFEANFLENKNQEVTASDLSDEFLKQAKAENLIQKYEAVNVEKIQFKDNAFDYCVCKEAYHHFPRAFLGLYEMIRVSSKATMLIEPIDVMAKMPSILLLKNILDRINPYLINKIWKNRFSFETVGNYVFKLSEREVEKIAMGMGLPCIAFNTFNVSYAPVSEEIMHAKYSPSLMRKASRGLFLKNILSKLKIIPDNVVCAVIFKTPPSQEVRASMKAMKYKIIDLPKNPYI